MDSPEKLDLTPEVIPSMPPGLVYERNFVSDDRSDDLLRRIDAQPWRADLKRRVQHYGWRYDYRTRRVGPEDRIGPLPEWLGDIARSLTDDGWMSRAPDQAIVNEYELGQGIAAHVDCEPCFGERIASVSLGAPCVMDFIERGTGNRAALVLEPGSLLCLSGSARYQWTHGIAARKSDVIDGVRTLRGRRVSITFRTVR